MRSEPSSLQRSKPGHHHSQWWCAHVNPRGVGWGSKTNTRTRTTPPAVVCVHPRARSCAQVPARVYACACTHARRRARGMYLPTYMRTPRRGVRACHVRVRIGARMYLCVHAGTRVHTYTRVRTRYARACARVYVCVRTHTRYVNTYAQPQERLCMNRSRPRTIGEGVDSVSSPAPYRVRYVAVCPGL